MAHATLFRSDVSKNMPNKHNSNEAFKKKQFDSNSFNGKKSANKTGPPNKSNVTERPKSRVMFGSKFRNNKVGAAENSGKKTLNKVSAETNQGKKPFDKKAWRLKKYSKKYKLEQWDEKRKKAVLQQYYQDLKDDTTKKFDVQKIYAENFDSDEERETNPQVNFVRHPSYQPKNLKGAAVIATAAGSSGSRTPDSAKQSDPGVKTKRRKESAMQAASREYQRIKEEKQARRDEIQKRKAEREEAMKVYKKNKAEKYKKLSKKNRKGQPIMKDRMEMLLAQIQTTT